MSQTATPKNKETKNKTKTHSQDSIPSFIRKTYDILEERKFPDIIDWNPEGTALVIKKPSEFCQKVLPAYFKHNNLTSFVRQLNMYNFHKRRTQNIDHVYYHELFQKGKKHLLKEIKRKNHDHGLEKVQKPLEIEPATTGKDVNSLLYENQLLKRLYNDAVSKISALENQVKDLSVHNQSLWTQVGPDTNGNFKPFFKFDSKSELTQEQLPMTFSEVMIPPLKLAMEKNPSLMMAKFPSLGNVGCFFNFANAKEEATESTDASHTSPSLQTNLESEKNYDMTETGPNFSEAPSGRAIQLPTITLNPSSTFFANFKPNDLMICSRKETSIGHLFESWNMDRKENTNNNAGELFIFADQAKNDKNLQEPGPTSVLGKRPLENIDNPEFQVPEPAMKKEFSLLLRKGLMSNGTDDGAFFRDVENMDLMDFGQSLFGWTKAT